MPELKLSYLDARQDRTDLLKKWLLRSIVAISFIWIGKGKFEAHSQWIEIFECLGFGQWLRYFTGVLQVGGGLLVLIPRASGVGIIMLAITMVGAMGAWVFFLGAPLFAIIPAAILGGLIVAGADDLMELVSSLRWDKFFEIRKKSG